MEKQTTIQAAAKELAAHLQSQYSDVIEQSQKNINEMTFDLVNSSQYASGFDDFADMIVAIISVLGDPVVAERIKTGPWKNEIDPTMLFELYRFLNCMNSAGLEMFYDHLHLSRYHGGMNENEFKHYKNKYSATEKKIA